MSKNMQLILATSRRHDCEEEVQVAALPDFITDEIARAGSLLCDAGTGTWRGGNYGEGPDRETYRYEQEAKTKTKDDLGNKRVRYG